MRMNDKKVCVRYKTQRLQSRRLSLSCAAWTGYWSVGPGLLAGRTCIHSRMQALPP